jgi:hypothetical protein
MASQIAAVIGLVLGISAAFGQVAPTYPNESQHARLEHDGVSGNLELQARGTRPLVQAITAVRRHFGWVIDYEESAFDDSDYLDSPDGGKDLMIRSLTVAFREPVNDSHEEVRRAIESAVMSSRYGSRNVRIDEPSRDRFSIASYSGSRPLVLDAMITMPPASRSLDDAIAFICSAAARSLGKSCVEGGIVDKELLFTNTKIGSTSPIRARELLAQVLDSALHRKVWLLTFEPSEDQYVIGIETAVWAEETNGVLRATHAIPQLPGN